MSTATQNGVKDRQQSLFPIEVEEAPKRKGGNPMMQKLDPEMLNDTNPSDVMAGFTNEEFCLEKCYRLILEQSGIKAKEYWLIFCSNVWDWQEESERRKSGRDSKLAISRLAPKLEKLAPDVATKRALLERLKLELGED